MIDWLIDWLIDWYSGFWAYNTKQTTGITWAKLIPTSLQWFYSMIIVKQCVSRFVINLRGGTISTWGSSMWVSASITYKKTHFQKWMQYRCNFPLFLYIDTTVCWSALNLLISTYCLQLQGKHRTSWTEQICHLEHFNLKGRPFRPSNTSARYNDTAYA